MAKTVIYIVLHDDVFQILLILIAIPINKQIYDETFASQILGVLHQNGCWSDPRSWSTGGRGVARRNAQGARTTRQTSGARLFACVPVSTAAFLAYV